MFGCQAIDFFNAKTMRQPLQKTFKYGSSMMSVAQNANPSSVLEVDVCRPCLRGARWLAHPRKPLRNSPGLIPVHARNARVKLFSLVNPAAAATCFTGLLLRYSNSFARSKRTLSFKA